METLLGRRRWIPELEARNPSLRGAGERMAINMPIQGTAADVMKIALIRLHERLRREGSRARMLLSVHDEVLLEVPRDDVEATAPIVRAAMEDALPLYVPLDVDIKSGNDWESLTPMAAALAERAIGGCPSFPRSRRSRASSTAAATAPRSRAFWTDWPQAIKHPAPGAFAGGRRRAARSWT